MPQAVVQSGRLKEFFTLLRHLVAIAILPGTVVVLIPIWIVGRYQVRIVWPQTAGNLAFVLLGCVLLAIGGTLFVASLRRFADEGRGTLAPWDPPRRFVVQGPYRYVRNPMVSGVIFLLAGEAAVLRSLPHLVWTLTFIVINLTYIPLLEEPLLATKFGKQYEEYSRHVGRFLPRLRPWRGAD